MPNTEARASIVRVACGRWPQPLEAGLVQQIAAATEGFAGADLQALCSAAVVRAATRVLPDLMNQVTFGYFMKCLFYNLNAFLLRNHVGVDPACTA